MKMMKISPEGTVYVPNRKPTAISSILPASGQVNANSIQERATAVHDLMGSPASVTNREDTSEGDRTCSDLQTLFRTHSVGPTTSRGARNAVGAHAVDSGQLTGMEDTNMCSRRSPSPIGQELIAPDTNLCARRSGSPIRQESIAPDSAHAVSENSFDTATPSVQATLPVQENQMVTMSEPTSEQTEAPNVPLSNTNGSYTLSCYKWQCEYSLFSLFQLLLFTLLWYVPSHVYILKSIWFFHVSLYKFAVHN